MTAHNGLKLWLHTSGHEPFDFWTVLVHDQRQPNKTLPVQQCLMLSEQQLQADICEESKHISAQLEIAKIKSTIW
jgi:hypothetical protein